MVRSTYTKGFNSDEIKIIRSNQENDPFFDIQSIKSNWNNKIIMFQNGILHTSSRLVGTSVEDSDVFLATFLHDTITLILNQHAISTSELPTSSC